MTYQPRFRSPEAPKTTAAEFAMLEFLQANREALHAAAELLGGPDGRKRVEGLFDDIPRAGLSARRVRRTLHALMALLSLDNTHVPESIECGCFAAIDPWDPRVEEICVLTDGLQDHLQALLAEEQASRNKRPLS